MTLPQLYRYIAKTILLATAFISLIVVALIFMMNLFNEASEIGTGDYGFLQALCYVALTLPRVFYQFFPMLVLLGGVLGLGILASNQELMVMRASGLSMGKIAMATFIAAAILISVTTLMGETLAPAASLFANQYKKIAENSGQAVTTESGTWIHQDNYFYHIENVVRRDHLEGVTRYVFNNKHQLLSVDHADLLDFKQNQWVIQNLIHTDVTTQRILSQKMAHGVWRGSDLHPSLVSVGFQEPEDISLLKLARYSNSLMHNGLQAVPFQFEFWKRMLQPLTTLVMLLLSLPFVFALPRASNLGVRIVIGVLIGFLFYILNALLGQISLVFQWSPLVAALLPSILFGMGGVMLMLRNT